MREEEKEELALLGVENAASSPPPPKPHDRGTSLPERYERLSACPKKFTKLASTPVRVSPDRDMLAPKLSLYDVSSSVITKFCTPGCMPGTGSRAASTPLYAPVFSRVLVRFRTASLKSSDDLAVRTPEQNPDKKLVLERRFFWLSLFRNTTPLTSGSWVG